MVLSRVLRCLVPTLLHVLSRHIGRQQAAHLAARYQTMKRLQLAASQSDTKRPCDDEPDSFFSTLAGQTLKAWFTSSDNKLLLNQLRLAGLACCQEDPAAAEVIPGAAEAARVEGPGSIPDDMLGYADVQPLEDITICVTGGFATPELQKREAVAQLIKDMGGIFKTSLTKDTDWLVVSGVLWCVFVCVSAASSVLTCSKPWGRTLLCICDNSDHGSWWACVWLHHDHTAQAVMKQTPVFHHWCCQQLTHSISLALAGGRQGRRRQEQAGQGPSSRHKNYDRRPVLHRAGEHHFGEAGLRAALTTLSYSQGCRISLCISTASSLRKQLQHQMVCFIFVVY